ncbi:MAG: prohibitin family protein [Bacteroidia bacterium]|nr:prohibitin family protein [Bacteroidia bacterium]
MNKTLQLFSLLLFTVFLTNCTIVRPGQAGVKQRLGKLSGKVVTQGVIGYNPFTSKVILTSVQTNNLVLTLNLPSKEGLSVTSKISILYRLEKDSVPSIITNLGRNYEPIISSIFRSASSDVCAKFYAKDMHSGMRAHIEDSIRVKMDRILAKEGIIIESVLMKSIQLPDGLSEAIEEKLKAEQNAMRMKFVLQQEKLEAERKIIEAKGNRDAQQILSEGLTKEIIELKSIEAFKELSTSPNTKVIISEGKTPFLID